MADAHVLRLVRRGARSCRPSVGGDASRIFETARRHPGQITPITGSVLLERALGGAVTLLLAGVGFLLAIGRYPIGAYLWIEAIFVVADDRRRVRLLLAQPCAAGSRSRCRSRAASAIETPARAVYDGIHGYRDHPWTLLVVCAVTRRRCS